MFERYVNFEFYKTITPKHPNAALFERYVNFEFYKTGVTVESIYNKFERYVNFEFYKTYRSEIDPVSGLRDM